MSDLPVSFDCGLSASPNMASPLASGFVGARPPEEFGLKRSLEDNVPLDDMPQFEQPHPSHSGSEESEVCFVTVNPVQLQSMHSTLPI